jgi:hypothetical protein
MRQELLDKVLALPAIEPSRANVLVLLFKPPVLVLLPIPALVALFAPLDVLSRYRALRAFTEVVAGWLPILRSHAMATQFPEVALLTNCLVPVVIVLMTMSAWVHMHKWRFYIVRERVLLGTVPTPREYRNKVLAGLLFLVGLVGYYAFPGDPSFAKGLTTDSRVGFALLSTCALGAGLIGFGLQYIDALLHYYFHVDGRRGK